MSGHRTTWTVAYAAEVTTPSHVDPVAVAAMALDGILLNEARSFTVSGPHGVTYVVDLADGAEAGAPPQIRAMTDGEFWLAFASVSRVMREGHEEDALEHGPEDPVLADRLFAEGAWRFGHRGMNRLVEHIEVERWSGNHLVYMAQERAEDLTAIAQGRIVAKRVDVHHRSEDTMTTTPPALPVFDTLAKASQMHEDFARMVTAERHRHNGLHAIRNAFSSPAWAVLDADVVNIDTVNGRTIVLNLADGTSIRIDAERYVR